MYQVDVNWTRARGGFLRPHKSGGQRADECQLVLVDGVPHAGVNPLGDLCAHTLEDGGGLVYTHFGDVEIDVAASEEHRCAIRRNSGNVPSS